MQGDRERCKATQERERDEGECCDHSHFSDEETEAGRLAVYPSYRMSKQLSGI